MVWFSSRFLDQAFWQRRLSRGRLVRLILALLLVGASFGPRDGVAREYEWAGVDGNRYVSPSWGFALDWDDETWRLVTAATGDDFADTEHDDLSDFLSLYQRHADTGSLTVHALRGVPPNFGDAEYCLSFESDLYETSEEVSNYQISVDRNGNEMIGTTPAGGYYGIFRYDVDLDSEDSEPATSLVNYLECRTLVPGKAVVIFRFNAHPEDFNQGIEDAIEVIDSTVIGSQRGGTDDTGDLVNPRSTVEVGN